jgi:Ca2+-binding RTX toxin-like protein
MNQRVILMLGVLAAAVLLTGGAVLARNIDCTGGLCTGTKKSDNLVGTAGDDEIVGRGGGDTLIGDPVNSTGDDLLRGGGGNDTISDPFDGADVDTVFGGKGNDVINVREGASGGDDPDVVDCGPGTDTVVVDPTDTRLNCEILNPN